jgi:hypothetical protein
MPFYKPQPSLPPAAAGSTVEGASEGPSLATSPVAPTEVDGHFDGLEEVLDNETQVILQARAVQS